MKPNPTFERPSLSSLHNPSQIFKTQKRIPVCPLPKLLFRKQRKETSSLETLKTKKRIFRNFHKPISENPKKKSPLKIRHCDHFYSPLSSPSRFDGRPRFILKGQLSSFSRIYQKFLQIQFA